MKMLENQVAIVTGSGRGWGQGIARLFAKEGAMTVVSARTQSEIDHTVAMIESEGGQAIGWRADVSDETALRGMIEGVVEKYGRLDVMVNNAAVLPLKNFEDMTMEEIDRAMTINLRGVIFADKLCVEIMKKQGGGSIINVSSNAGAHGFEKESIYCTAKFGLEGFTQSIAMELAQYNIAVNTITPGGHHFGMRIKPTNITQAELEAMTEAEKSQWGDPILFSEAFVYLGIQRPKAGGVTGKRILSYELCDRIRKNGYGVRFEDMAFDDKSLAWY